jgi:hypothetical protein
LALFIPGISATQFIQDTTLFLQADTAWEHSSPGDVFVVRTNVKNVGNYPAVLVRVNLENIPDDWQVRPGHHWVMLLLPQQIEPRFFVVERGATDATIYAKADALNAPPVISNHIAIPISWSVLAILMVVCSAVLYREVKSRKKAIR